TKVRQPPIVAALIPPSCACRQLNWNRRITFEAASEITFGAGSGTSFESAISCRATAPVAGAGAKNSTARSRISAIQLSGSCEKTNAMVSSLAEFIEAAYGRRKVLKTGQYPIA